MSFLDGVPRIATENDCTLRWSGGKPGEFFRCRFCGHKFAVGDQWRFVFTNDMPNAPGNPLVCADCDGPDVRDRWAAKWAEWREIERAYWWFAGLEPAN